MVGQVTFISPTGQTLAWHTIEDTVALPDANDVVTINGQVYDVGNRDFVYFAGKLSEINVILNHH